MTITSIPHLASPHALDGLISGVGTRGVISRIMGFEGGPLRTLKLKREQVELRNRAYRELRTHVRTVQSPS